MKKLLKIIPAVILIMVITYSCSDDFFHKPPPGSSSELLFYNEAGIQSLLIGAYANIGAVAYQRPTALANAAFGSMASDDAYKGSEFGDGRVQNYIERWEVYTDHSFPAGKWNWAYGYQITRSNEVLRFIDIVEERGDVAPERANQYRAEARFIRALANFEAWRIFHNIPIIHEYEEDPSMVSNINPEGAVLEHIINDLEFAWGTLPEVQSDPGRPTRYAAMALAAKAYLGKLKYAEAKPLLENIIQSGKYELAENFFDNFRIVHNNNNESIFEIQASVNDGTTGGNGYLGIGLYMPHGGDIGLCCGQHQMSQNLVNAYRVDEDGLPVFDMVNVHLKHDYGVGSSEYFEPFEDEVDPRLDWTVGRRGIPWLDWGINRGHDWIRRQLDGGPYMTPKKRMFYQSERNTFSEATGWRSGINALNYKYIRYAHVLLWRAEVAAYEGDLETARTYVNMVRERADNEYVMGRVLVYELTPSVYPWGEGTDAGDWQSGGDVDWDQPAANYKVGLYPQFADRAEAMRAVQWEHRLEFATEGHRFFDLRRWDNLPSEINSVPMAETLNAFAQNDIRTFMDGAVFTEMDKLQPIPQHQIDLRPDVLVQNPGY
jgi:starch-binding outer membrane protein, SusD/RagB family